MDTLNIGDHMFDVDPSVWRSCAKVHRGTDAHGYLVRIKAFVTADVARAFVALLVDPNCDLPRTASAVFLMDTWLLANTVGHQALCDTLERTIKATNP